MKPGIKLAVAILPLLLVVGCGSTEVKDDAAADSGDAVLVSGGASTSGASEGTRLGDDGTLGDEQVSGEELVDDSQSSASVVDADLLAERKVYFDFDLSEIKGEYEPILQAHADYLLANPDVSLVIEGHCDERGTREYNIALGERRAFVVSQFFALRGVSKDQVRVVSFGEERPDVEGHDDSAWKWNRRAVLVYSE